MIVVFNKADSLLSISKKYGVPLDKIYSDNGLGGNKLPVAGQSIIVLKAKEFLVVQNDTTVNKISEKTGKDVNTIFRNNYFLSGRQNVPPLSYVVLEYENMPTLRKITGGYAYDFISTSKLLETVNYLNYIMPFTYGFTKDGNLVEAQDEFIINIAKQHGISPLMHVSTLTKEGVFDSNLPIAVFENNDSLDTLLYSIMDTVDKKGYDGVDVDFEFLPFEQRENYVDFLAQLSERLHEKDKILIVALPPKTSDNQKGALYEGIDYGEIGKYADYVLLMTYEYGYRFGPPLAIAPIPSVRRVIEYAKTRIPSRKLLLGVPNYGYDWTLPYVRGQSDAPSISPLEAVDIARRNNVDIKYDEYSKAPYFNYTDDDGKEHEVWFEDARSYEEKVKLVEEYDMAGAFIWEIMRDNPQGYVTLNSLIKIM